MNTYIITLEKITAFTQLNMYSLGFHRQYTVVEYLTEDTDDESKFRPQQQFCRVVTLVELRMTFNFEMMS